MCTTAANSSSGPRFSTTTLNAVLASKHPSLQLQTEDLFWWDTGADFGKASGRPWQCATECKSKSCCCYQAFDQASYEEAITPHHVFKLPIWKVSLADGQLLALYTKQLDQTNQPADDLLDKFVALEDKLDRQRTHTARRTFNIRTKLEVLLHHAKLRTDTDKHAEGLRQSQKGRAKRRAFIAAHRAKKQRTTKL